MNSIIDFPEEIIDVVKDFLWGNIDSQKKCFNSILKKNFSAMHAVLTPAPYCIFSGELLEIEDEIFCENCGEKTIFPFTRSICHTCEYYQRGEGTQVLCFSYPKHKYF